MIIQNKEYLKSDLRNRKKRFSTTCINVISCNNIFTSDVFFKLFFQNENESNNFSFHFHSISEKFAIETKNISFCTFE
jgi:serine protease inhibitor